jgi:Ca-activated chloride channel family protein
MNQNLAGIQQGQPDPEIKQAIVDLGLAYRLLTQFTSFVAVEEMTITRGGEPVKVTVPVEMPEGVSHEGVFGFDMSPAGGVVMSSRAVPLKRGAAKGVASLGYTAAAPAASELQLGVRAADVDFDATVDASAGNSPEAYEAFLKMMDTMEKEGKLKPEEKRERILQVKLAPELQGLAGKVKEDGSFSEGKVQVKDGRIEVTVYLGDASEATMTKLADLGFTVILKPQSANMVIGSIEVKKLEELALLKEVRRVQLAMYSESK